jgi:hypothetical protein
MIRLMRKLSGRTFSFVVSFVQRPARQKAKHRDGLRVPSTRDQAEMQLGRKDTHRKPLLTGAEG